MSLFKRFVPHALVILGFIIASLAYFSPVLSGKKIKQSDIVQYTGMAKQQNDFRKQTGEETYWTDSAFGGMPTYQLGARYPHNYVKKLDRIIRFLPRPADYLFLYFIGFYILLLVLKVDYKLAFLGSLAFGFSTYFIIILGVGHNAKAHAIGYMPLVLSGIILTFRKNYIFGGILLALSMALELAANHFQMTYYLFLLVLVLGVVYLIEAYKNKTLPDFFKAVGVMVVAVIFSVLLNATNILATQEYAKYSSRGDTGITIEANGSLKKKSGLGFDYITEYSYGIAESFNLFIPRFMGGASNEDVGTDSNVYQELLTLGARPNEAKYYAENAPTYWGDQTIIGAPAYIGAVVIFLFVLGLFLIQGRLKWWIVGGSVLALLLSWGRNFKFLTVLFIDYFPLYDKFRAVSSIQVIIELCLPILGIVAVQKFLSQEITLENKIKAIKYTTAITGGLALFFLLFKSTLFSFSGGTDGYFIDQMGPNYVRALKEDRKAMFTADTIRSLVFVLLVAGVCWFYLKEKLKSNMLLISLGVLILADLVWIDKKYVNAENFVSARNLDIPFVATNADKEIMKDKSHYRVYDISGNPVNSARASYFHKAFGGYHAAKPGRAQDLFEFYVAKGSVRILNMLNVKYIITPDQKEGPQAQINENANGNAWFVSKLNFVDHPNDEILGLKELDNKKEAIVNTKFRDVVAKNSYAVDSTATIQLTSYQPNHLRYETQNSTESFAVFSETYYPGWNAYIDGKLVDHAQVNYMLRGMVIPSGKHNIEFKFEPAVVQRGSTITLTTSVLFLLLVIGGMYWHYKKEGTWLPQVKD